MISTVLANFIDCLKGAFFHLAERKRLKGINERICKYKTLADHDLAHKSDFYTQAHNLVTRDDYNELLQHEGIEFWTRYYEGEHPECILDHSLISHRIHRNFENHNSLVSHLLVPYTTKKP